MLRASVIALAVGLLGVSQAWAQWGNYPSIQIQGSGGSLYLGADGYQVYGRDSSGFSLYGGGRGFQYGAIGGRNSAFYGVDTPFGAGFGLMDRNGNRLELIAPKNGSPSLRLILGR
jgi:hypothetical protein